MTRTLRPSMLELMDRLKDAGATEAAIVCTHGLFAGKAAVANPWDATTLEWTVPSPPPHGNFIKEIIVYPIRLDDYLEAQLKKANVILFVH